MILLCSFAVPLASLDPREEPRLARIAGAHYYESTPFEASWPPESWGNSDWHIHPSQLRAERVRPQSWAVVSHRSIRLAGVRGSLADLVNMSAVREMVDAGELIVRSLQTEAPGLHIDEQASQGVYRCYMAAAEAGVAPKMPLLFEGTEHERNAFPLPGSNTSPAIRAAWVAVHTSPTPEAAEVDVVSWLRPPLHPRTPRPIPPQCRWPAPLWAGGAA